MATAARDRLARKLLGEVKPAFSAGMAARLEDLSLHLEGLGRVKFPVTPATARKLISFGQPARFGRGEETLTDADVRDTWEIPGHLVSADWNDAALKAALATVKDELGLPNTAELTADFHSFLVYEPGQFFLPHQDSEKSDDMIGTLVVTLPSNYAGGELVVEHNEERRAYQGSRAELSLVAFYADCRHEVLKVRSGYRITLTYNLLLHGAPGQPEGDEGRAAELASLLDEHFSTPAPRYYGGPPAGAPNRLVYLLDHEYTPRALQWSRLKGEDASRVALLRAAAGRSGCETVLALADIHEMHGAYPADGGPGYLRGEWYDSYDSYERYDRYDDPSDEDPAAGEPDGEHELDRVYEIQELINSGVTLTHWTRQDGAGLEEISLRLSGSDVCASTPSGALRPYSQQYEGYMGNWGNTLDRWYHRAAVVVWPRRLAFANRAELSPARALDEIAAMASSGDVAGAAGAAATLASFWDDVIQDNVARANTARANTARANDAATGILGTTLFGNSLRVAASIADAATAAMLLRPFRIGSLTSVHIRAFAEVGDAYGQEWTADLLRTWFGGDRPVRPYDLGQQVRQWAGDWLPGLCEALTAMGGAVSTQAARTLLDLAWEWIGQDIRAAFRWPQPSRRDGELNDLGRPLAAVLTAASATKANSTRGLVTRSIRRQDDGAITLELSALHAAVKTPVYAGPGDVGLDALAKDCAARLRSRLARPAREAGDWSVELPADGCGCDVCRTLRTFLAARDRRTLEWPLAKDGRQHVHARIDGAELPVTHVTRRQGRPYTLVLVKTDALFTIEEARRVKDETDLAWLAGTWPAARR